MRRQLRQITDPLAPRPERTIRAIALDLDGTTFYGHDIHPRTRDAVLAAQRRGIPVVIVTGRVCRAALDMARQLGIQEPIIGSRGGSIRAMPREGDPVLNGRPAGPVLYERLVPTDIATAVVAAARVGGWYIQVNQNEHIYAQDQNDVADIYARRLGVPVSRVSRLEDVVQGGMLASFCMTSGGPDLERCRRAIEQAVGVDPVTGMPRADVTVSGPLVEVRHIDAWKSVGLEWWCKQNGISLDAVLAIGNDDNDLDMLGAVGYPVAVNGSPAATLAQSVVSCAIPEDAGVADVLDILGLSTGVRAPNMVLGAPVQRRDRPPQPLLGGRPLAAPAGPTARSATEL